MSRIVVIGANHAGTACVNTILDNYRGREVVVFDQNSNISFLGCGAALWIGDQIDGSDGLFYSSFETLQSKGAIVHTQTKVDRIDYNKKIVYVTDKNGKKFEQQYSKLVLATGSIPLMPRVEGINLEYIQQVKLFQDAEDIINKMETDDTIEHVTVIGAGYIGVELVEAFHLKGKKVTLIDIEKTCISTYYDDKFTQMMEDRLAENGIDLKFGQKIVAFEGVRRVMAVRTDLNLVRTDMVIMAIGFSPNNELGKNDFKLFRNGAYLVDEFQRTSMPDVYAVGDCATVYDNSIGDSNYIALATNAVRSGVVAGHNICGAELASPGVQGSNAVSIFGLNLISTGITLNKARANGLDVDFTDFSDYQRSQFMRTNEQVHLRIVFGKKSRRIMGAQIASSYDVSMGIHMFSLAIQEGVTIDKLKLLDIFFLPHFNQPYNYITMAALSAPEPPTKK